MSLPDNDTYRPQVLLVDDEKVSLRILSDLLKGEVNISLAKSGTQALEKVKKIKPDLILMDVLMPGMSGFDVIQQLKADKQTQAIPVIFITGLNSAGEEEKGLTLGAQDYIHKPFSPQVVKARVATQLEIIRQKQQLQQLSDELAQASEAKSRFLANMSHEIRTPLTSIIGYAQGITQGDFSAEFENNAVDIIAQNGQHLLNVVNEILDLSKIEANKLAIETIEMDIIALLNSIESLVKQQAQAKGLLFSIEYQLPLPSLIKSDPTRLKQILLNLINNAIKFTDIGTVTVRVKQISTEQLSFCIEDSGIGLSQSQIAQLFTDFTQVDSSIARKYGGTGLGLSIAKSLAHKLGGNIEVQSRPKIGSQFTLFTQLQLPQSPNWITSQAILNELRQQQSSKQKDSIPSLVGKVLLAEDHDDNRALFTVLLQRMGLEVTAVENGELAVHQSMVEDFDLVFLDIQMPVMDGISAMKMITTTAIGVPVIALTANAMTTDIDKYLAAGFTAHIAKPVDRSAFIALVQHYFDGDTGQNFDLDEATLLDLRTQFVETLKSQWIEMTTLHQNSNWPSLGAHAHALKGSAPMYGFEALGQIAGELELAVNAMDNTRIVPLSISLIAQLDNILHHDN